MMKKFVLFVLLSSLFGFSQEKTTTQDFGLNPKTETVVSKQIWANADYNKGVYLETLTFYNTYLQSKKIKTENTLLKINIFIILIIS
jgi:hypothetical protein